MAELKGPYPCQLALLAKEVREPGVNRRLYKCEIRQLVLSTSSTLARDLTNEIGYRGAKRLERRQVIDLVCSDCEYRKMVEREDKKWEK